MQLNDGRGALKCFITAETLEISANHIDTLHPPLLSRLKIITRSPMVSLNKLVNYRNQHKEFFKQLYLITILQKKVHFLMFTRTITSLSCQNICVK